MTSAMNDTLIEPRSPESRGASKSKPAANETRRHPDRVTLQPQHLEKLDSWVGQVANHCKGVSVSRNQMIQWLLESKHATLDADELRSLGAEFFQEELFLKQLSLELKARRAAGESISLGELMERILPAKKITKARVRKSEASDQHEN